ncbi:MAG: hypothetical protein WDA71_09400 [Actinomycetota bacterium]
MRWLASFAGTTDTPSVTVFRTHDGGTAWQEQQVPQQSAEASWRIAVSLPTFFDLGNGVLPVQVLVEPDDKRLYF